MCSCPSQNGQSRVFFPSAGASTVNGRAARSTATMTSRPLIGS